MDKEAMSVYNFDLHIHSSRSFDGRMSRDEIVHRAKEKAISGVAICDHNVNPEFDAPRIEDGVLVIPGIEMYTDCGHLLGLFIESEIELPGDVMGVMPLREAVERIHRAGGIAVMAHPYQRKRNFDKIDEIVRCCDGLEIFNSRAPSGVFSANRMAKAKAASAGIACVTAGSDAHLKREIGGGICRITADSLSADDIKTAILQGHVETTGRTCRRIDIAASQLTRYKNKYGRRLPPRILAGWIKLLIICIIRDIAYPIHTFFNNTFAR